MYYLDFMCFHFNASFVESPVVQADSLLSETLGKPFSLLEE